MAKYDVVITINGRAIIGETTYSLAQARKRLKYEQRKYPLNNESRIVDIVKDGNKLIESSHPERIS